MRTVAEQTLNSFVQQDIENFVQYCLATIVNNNLENSSRINAVILLKKNLVIGKNKPSFFLNLCTQSRSQLQIKLLTYLNEIDNDALISQISDFLSDMASSLYNDKISNLPESEKWGELMNHLFDLYKTNKIK